MLLKITTHKEAATDLSFLLHKHPDKVQSVEIPSGKAHIFYPQATGQQCSVCLLLDINPIALVKNAKRDQSDFVLAHYVNDRPYVASSYMSVAISKAFNTAMNGTCKAKPALVDQVMPLEVSVSVLPAPRGGEVLIRRLFEPLGYTVELTRHRLDTQFDEWGESRYFTLKLQGEQRLKDLLSHLYVLIPVLDTHKHYWVNHTEVEKLLTKGRAWLSKHPQKEQITKRYLKGLGRLTRSALDRLLETDANNTHGEEELLDKSDLIEKKESLHDQRLNLVLEELKATGAQHILDLGCGEGKLVRLLLKEKQFTKILGMDVSFRTLERAVERLHYNEMSPKQKERLAFIQGALTYRDKRLNGFDAAAIVEVIEHLDLDRLEAFERVVFEFAKPTHIVLTTPNKEYNQLFERMKPNQLRHTDHRFEWTREEFDVWVKKVCTRYDYEARIKAVGEVSENVGAPSQMAIFNVKK